MCRGTLAQQQTSVCYPRILWNNGTLSSDTASLCLWGPKKLSTTKAGGGTGVGPTDLDQV